MASARSTGAGSVLGLFFMEEWKVLVLFLFLRFSNQVVISCT